MDLTLRPAREGDIPFLTAVYNQAIAAGGRSCDLDPVTEADREAFLRSHRDPRCPLFLCLRAGEVVGYAYLSPYRPGRRALATVAEISYYLDFRCHGQGIGSWLLPRMETEARRLGYETLLAILLAGNAPSLALLRKNGYQEWGRLPAVAHLADTQQDHLILGKHL